MSVANFFNKTVYIRRLRKTGYKSSFYATATADASIQQMDVENAQRLGISQSRRWMGFFELDTDIKVGDKLTDSVTSDSYEVEAITKVDFGINQYLECVLVETNG